MTAKLRFTALVESLLSGLYERIAAIEAKLASLDELRDQHAVLRREAADLVETMKAIVSRQDSAIQLLGDISARLPPLSIIVGDRLLVSRVKQFVMALPAEDVILTSFLTMYGTIAIGLELFFSRLLRPGMTFVDVGAHIGIHTLV